MDERDQAPLAATGEKVTDMLSVSRVKRGERVVRSNSAKSRQSTKMKNFDLDHQKLLRGEYEAQALPRDFSEHSPVPDFAYNILNRRGLLYRPIVDEDRVDKRIKRLKWPGDKPFAVCLTHDVDFVSAYSLAGALRHRRTRYAAAQTVGDTVTVLLGTGADLLSALGRVGAKDPLHRFERWLEVERDVDARSTFFFWPGTDTVSRRHASDCSYTLSDTLTFERQTCSVSEMIREMHRRGWEIGLHASWYAFNDVDELKRQKDALETATGSEVVSVRQHYLHYDIRTTPRAHSDAGFKFDSTLGFNDNIGFRFGTCYPWRLNDLSSGEKLPIFEIPLIVQEVAMLNPAKGMRIDAPTAFEYIKQIGRAVENVGGVLTLLWHPNSVVDLSGWNLYLETIRYFRAKNAWFGGIKEIMAHVKRIFPDYGA